MIVGPDGKNAKKEVFASGWIEGDQGYLGRPADMALLDAALAAHAPAMLSAIETALPRSIHTGT